MAYEMKPFANDVFGNKVFMAETDEIDKQRANVDKLLWLVAPFMGWADISHVFVSDMSSLGDFGLEDTELQQIQTTLGFPVKADDYLYEIAGKMKP